ncbi:hypothetical protein [Pseudomonas sp. TMB3-21]
MSTSEAGIPQEIGLSVPVLHQARGAVLDPADRKAIIRIRPYTGMACGDRLLVSWTGLDVEGVVYRREFARFISERQVGAAVVVVIDGEHIAALDGGSLEVYYTLQSARITEPARSGSLHLSVGDASTGLLPACVPEAVRDTLDPGRVPQGTLVTIRAYSRMSVGDRVELYWTGISPQASLTDTLMIEAFALGGELSFWINPEQIAPNLNSTVTIAYSVRQGEETRHSQPAQLMIGPLIRATLAPPEILEADNGWLALEDVLEGATISIVDAETEDGELVYLKCNGEYFSHRDAREISKESAGEPLEFSVPYPFWKEHRGSTVKVSYSIERLDDVTQQSEMALLQVRS